MMSLFIEIKMICPVCQAELEPYMIVTMDDDEVQWTLRYGKRDEPVFYCPNVPRSKEHGMNLWTVTWIKNWLRMMKRRKKLKMSY